MEILEGVQQRATKRTKDLVHLSYEERLRDGTLLSREEKVQGNLIKLPDGKE